MRNLLSSLTLRASMILLFSLCAGSALAQKVEYPNHGITVSLNRPIDEPIHGYIEYRFEIRNESSDAHEVTITMPEYTYSRRTYLREVKRTVKVEAHRTVSASLFETDFPVMRGQSIKISIDGDDQDSVLQYSFEGQRSYGGRSSSSPEYHLLISERARRILTGDLFTNYKNRVRGFADAAGFHEGGSVNDWSDQWLGYTGFGGILVTADDLQTMKPEVRSTIFRYVESGGRLVIFGKYTLPKTWNQVPARLPTYEAAFGFCTVVEQNPLSINWLQQNWGTLHSKFYQTVTPWASIQSVSQAHYSFPVVDDISIPVRGLFVVVLVFGFIIGPVNISLLNKKKKRIWMLWTVPVISLVTCVLVFLFMIVVEGWDKHSRTETITVLDQSSKRASTIGWTGFYSPIVPGDGLRFSYNTELAWQNTYGKGYYGSHSRGGRTYSSRQGRSSQACSIDWTEQQQLSQGWLSPRVPCLFQVRKSELRTERVTVYQDDAGQVTISNLLGVPIERLILRDAEGRVLSADHIEAGAKATLTPHPGAVEANKAKRPLSDLYLKNSFLESLQYIQRDPSGFLRPMTYIAELRHSPFLENGLGEGVTANDHCWVYGILDEIKKTLKDSSPVKLSVDENRERSCNRITHRL